MRQAILFPKDRVSKMITMTFIINSLKSLKAEKNRRKNLSVTIFFLVVDHSMTHKTHKRIIQHKEKSMRTSKSWDNLRTYWYALIFDWRTNVRPSKWT